MLQRQWQVAGSAPENYERYLVPSIFGPWARELVDLADPRPGERIVDVACGTGIVARLAAERIKGGHVVGLDINPGMIAVARSIGPNIEWYEGNALEMPLADASFDLVFCQQGLQFFPDRLASAREMRRVLAPGGRLALCCWRSIDDSPGFGALLVALEHHCPEGAATMRAPFSLGDSEELRHLLSQVGFKEIRLRLKSRVLEFASVNDFVRQYVAGSPLAGPVAKLDGGARGALLNDVATALAKYVGDAGLRFPIVNQLVNAIA